MLHPLWRVSYVIFARPPGTNFSPKSIFINSYGRWCPLISNPVMLIVSDRDSSNIILVSSLSDYPSRSNHSCPIWDSWAILLQGLSLVSCMSFQGFLMLWFCDVIDPCPVPISSFFYSPISVPTLCRRFPLLGLAVDLMVASILLTRQIN